MFRELIDYYEWTLTLADPRTKGWLMVDSPIPTIGFVILYLLMVWQGPKYMRE